MNKPGDEMRPEYELRSLTGKVRGKYQELYSKESRVVVINPDLLKRDVKKPSED